MAIAPTTHFLRFRQALIIADQVYQTKANASGYKHCPMGMLSETAVSIEA
jgi:hypothetical protein